MCAAQFALGRTASSVDARRAITISEKLNDRTVVGISLESSFRLSLRQTGPFRPLTAESERAVNATREAEHRHLGKARHQKK